VKLSQFTIAVTSTFFATQASAWVNSNSCGNFSNNRCFYNASKAKEYAQQNYWRKTNDSIFPYLPGANCTNFASQVIAAGFIGSNQQSTVRNKIPNYNVDYHPSWPDSWKWYYLSDYTISTTWKGADWLYQYVQHQNGLPSYETGVHFDYITEDNYYTALEFHKIQVGDIIFVDWGYGSYTLDGEIDHVMIVTQKTGNSYAGIRVTYQSGGGDAFYVDHPLNNLGWLGTYPQTSSIFYVYRPTYYKQ